MPVRNNGYFNNPAFAQAASNLASLFEPPSGTDAAGWANAADTKMKTEALKQALDYANSPDFNPDMADRRNVLADLYDPTNGYGARNMDDATKRYGYDTQATTSRANNADDNARAMELGQLSELQKLFGPLNEGQVRPELPEDIAGRFGVDHGLRSERGLPKALSKTEVEGHVMQGMSPELQQAITFGSTPIEPVVTPEGPRNVTRLDAIGEQPYSKPAVDTGSIPAGHRLTYDDKGNIASMEPIPGSPAAMEAQRVADAAVAKDRTAKVNANIVVEDIDRALAQIDASPSLTTGPGAALTSRVPGTPAYQTNSLVDTVKANAGFDKLQAMRDASPTGGALGAVSEYENRLLQAAIGNLELAQDDEQIRYNLKRVSNIYRDIIDGQGNGERYDLAQPGGPLAGGTGAPAAPPAPVAGDVPQQGGYPEGTVIQNAQGQKMVRRGGKWEPM